jgi:hypothetical protein
MKIFLGKVFPGMAVSWAVLTALCLGLSGCPQITDSILSMSITGIAISPPNPGVAKGKTQIFTATVEGINNPPQTVAWSVEGGAAGTTISDGGLLSVSVDETARVLTVRATSTYDTTKFGRANVTVTGAAQYTVTFNSHGALRWRL